MQNIEFKYDRKEPSDSQIESAKNFDAVLSKAVQQNGFSIGTKSFLAISAIALVALFTWFIFSPDEESSKAVITPLPGFDLEKESYKINVGQENKLTYPTGSVIHIPANAFIDKNGNLIKGEVEIFYREFHNPAEILVSGIPMTYDTLGTQYHFESAGMFDISGIQNKEPVFIHPEKRITVEMASRNEGDYFNQYFLDTVTGNWNYSGKDNFKKIVEDKAAVPVETNPSETLISKVEKPIKPQKEQSDFHSFEIVFNEEEFPELTVYRGLKFQVDKNERNFTADFARTIWENAAIARGTKEGKYLITLSKGEESHSFNCVPVVAEKDYQAAVVEYEKLFSQYKDKESRKLKKQDEKQKLLEAKQEKFEKEQLERQRRENEALKRFSEIYETERTVFRTFEISQFGIWNSDAPSLLPSGQSILASYINENGESIKMNRIFLVEKNKNALFAYADPAKLQFNPESDNILIGITENNKVCVFDQNSFKNLKRADKNQILRMKVSNERTKTVSDVIKLLDT